MLLLLLLLLLLLAGDPRRRAVIISSAGASRRNLSLVHRGQFLWRLLFCRVGAVCFAWLLIVSSFGYMLVIPLSLRALSRWPTSRIKSRWTSCSCASPLRCLEQRDRAHASGGLWSGGLATAPKCRLRNTVARTWRKHGLLQHTAKEIQTPNLLNPLLEKPEQGAPPSSRGLGEERPDPPKVGSDWAAQTLLLGAGNLSDVNVIIHTMFNNFKCFTSLVSVTMFVYYIVNLCDEIITTFSQPRAGFRCRRASGPSRDPPAKTRPHSTAASRAACWSSIPIIMVLVLLWLLLTLLITITMFIIIIISMYYYYH